MKLLMNRSLTIDQHGLERIMQAVLFYAESVTVRAAAVDGEGDERIYRRLRELLDLGALRTWAYEYELTSAGVPRGNSTRNRITSRVPDHVVTIEETRELMQGIDRDVLTHAARKRSQPVTILQEGISEIVQFRHSVGLLRLTDQLGADGVVLGRGAGSSMIGNIEKVTTSVDAKEAVVREIVGLCRFGPLAHLSLDAVSDCRKAMPQFNYLLEQRLTGSFTEGQPDGAAASELATRILAEYRKVAPAERPRHRLGAGSVWDVVGAVLPSAVAVRMIGARVEWFKYRSHSRPFMLLSRLNRHHN